MSQKPGSGALVLGLMSGTSLDGLDMALCRFESGKDGYKYSIEKAKTSEYTKEWKQKLSSAPGLKAEAYFSLHAEYGRYMAGEIARFLQNEQTQPDLIASHGHTVFHQPEKGFSTQLGCGATLAALTRIDTVCDFRSKDVALGGQGAPLVPLGDRLLFPQYHGCLNIGGIANISYENSEGKRLAFDICEANMLLNHLSEKGGKAYDNGGEMARTGKVDAGLFNQLNAFDYYKEKRAKSMGREWFEENILQLMAQNQLPLETLLATSVEHIAMQISDTVNTLQLKTVLCTGGGVLNDFMMERIKKLCKAEMVIPDKTLLNFKEALIFAFLGYLRVLENTNTLGSVTAASRDSIGGGFYKGG